MVKGIKKHCSNLIQYIKDNYIFLSILLILYIILTFPLNYYIIVGGGTSDVSSRIKVSDGYSSKGSFNISYVSELQGTTLTYLLSYLIPTWEREDANLYKYNDNESIEDIEFRSNLDLKVANGNATYWAYKLANKEVQLKSKQFYVITISPDVKTTFHVGDEILEIDEEKRQTLDEYRSYIQSKSSKDTLKVKVLRKKKEILLDVPLFEENGVTMMGVVLQGLNSYEINPNVQIKFRSSESGPSGGLITTLEMYNQLTKKDLTKGLKIAGTGTIEEDGSIGEIGGVEHKLLGAYSDKVDLFLVPEGDNYKDALKYKEKNHLKIKILSVSSIEDAINQLKNL
ncbi:MAG: PDZ domain-containing protein [Bacilli bacterium]|nr:PDZ domain-containing protein [Bacilli bacterium]